MSELSVITAAPATITLKNRGENVVLTLHPLTDRDYGELDNWVRSQVISTARNSYTDDMEQEERDKLLEIAMKQASCSTWSSYVGIELLHSITGIVKLLRFSTRKSQPDIDVDLLHRMMRLGENIKEFNRVFSELNSAKELTNGKPSGN